MNDYELRQLYAIACQALLKWHAAAKLALRDADLDDNTRIWIQANDIIGYAGAVRDAANERQAAERKTDVSSRN